MFRPSLALVALVFAAAPAAAQKKYALLVGVNKYNNRKLADLNHAEQDVSVLGKELGNKGFEVRLLLGSAAGAEKATKENLEAAVAGLLRKVTKSDTLLVAFAGHGQQFQPAGEREEQPFFCPVDATPSEAPTLFPLNRLLQQLDEKGAGTNLVLIDACRTVRDPNRGTRSGIDGTKAVALSEGTVVFFACSRDQEARETDKMFKENSGKGHGVFFHHVIEAVRGEAANSKGEVTWDRLVVHVKEKTAQRAAIWFPDVPKERIQKPQSIGNLSGDIVLVRGVPPIAANVAPVAPLIENPYRTAKVGDYAVYKMNVSLAGIPVGGNMAKVVTAMTDTEATVTLYMNLGTEKAMPSDSKIDLTKPFDHTKLDGLGSAPDAKLEKVADGKERMVVAGRGVQATWATLKFSGKIQGNPFSGEMKVWMSKDLPHGIAKAQLVGTLAGQKFTTEIELVETGNNKK